MYILRSRYYTAFIYDDVSELNISTFCQLITDDFVIVHLNNFYRVDFTFDKPFSINRLYKMLKNYFYSISILPRFVFDCL